jgi:hypothetical protein
MELYVVSHFKLTVCKDAIDETIGVLKGVFKKKPNIPFSLSPEEANSLFDDLYKGTAKKFLEELPVLPSDAKYKQLTVILINHGDSQGFFGSGNVSLEQEVLLIWQRIYLLANISGTQLSNETNIGGMQCLLWSGNLLAREHKGVGIHATAC